MLLRDIARERKKAVEATRDFDDRMIEAIKGDWIDRLNSLRLPGVDKFAVGDNPDQYTAAKIAIEASFAPIREHGLRDVRVTSPLWTAQLATGGVLSCSADKAENPSNLHALSFYWNGTGETRDSFPAALVTPNRELYDKHTDCLHLPNVPPSYSAHKVPDDDTCARVNAFYEHVPYRVLRRILSMLQTEAVRFLCDNPGIKEYDSFFSVFHSIEPEWYIPPPYTARVVQSTKYTVDTFREEEADKVVETDRKRARTKQQADGAAAADAPRCTYGNICTPEDMCACCAQDCQWG